MFTITIGEMITYDQGWFVNPLENKSTPVWLENVQSNKVCAKVTIPDHVGRGFELHFLDNFRESLEVSDPVETVFLLTLEMRERIKTVNVNRKLAPWDFAAFPPADATPQEAQEYDSYKALWTWVAYWINYGLNKFGVGHAHPVSIAFAKN